jgi:acyl CoA:acetate/3-ketoacid CoA transferase alpha subunit/acyl CoA:acetate/3-ketoacid CoA transferase beta subunit
MSKRCSLESAVARFVRPGDHIHLAYSEARPNAAVLALCRQFAGSNPRFTISSGGLVSSQAALVTEGLAERIIASFIGDNYPSGAPNSIYQDAIDSGQVHLEEATLWTLVARLAAGAMGVPFMPVRSLEGSDLANQEWVSSATDVTTGSTVTTVAAIQPDIVVLHGVAADEDGNVILSPPYGEASWGALAAKRGVIAGVERIVSRDVIRRHQSLVSIPAHSVVAVCEVPLGAHPYGLYSPIPEVDSYVEDEAFILEQRRASHSSSDYSQWVQQWVRDLPDQAAYLNELGQNRIAALIGGAGVNSWSLISETDDGLTAPTPEELMVLAGAALLEHKLCEQEFDVLMTGIGFANLAAWVANHRLAANNSSVPLMAEIGLYGYEPRPGDPFIFSHRNLPTAAWMTDVTSILGCIVAGGGSKSLAVVGAGMIDQAGCVNSSRTERGGFLVGSGGANDIASGAGDLVVVLKHGATRLVPKVPFVTCPGTRVTSIVTTAGVLTRDRAADEFVLTSVIAPQGNIEEGIRRAREGCGWELQVARHVDAAPEPKSEDVALLRSFDPRHRFLPMPTQGGKS